MRYTRALLRKLEKQAAQRAQVRYAKGEVGQGICLLNNQPVLVLNRYSSLEVKIEALLRFLDCSKPSQ